MRPIALLLIVAGCKHSEQPKQDSVVVPAASVKEVELPPVLGSKTRTGAAGTTTGTISCGTARCTATKEACVLRDGLWSCVAVEEAPTSDRKYECDDVSDCTEHGDDVCCSNDRKSAYCGSMRAVDSSACQFAACNTDQAAPSCPAGQSCVDGICRPPPPRATCTGKKPCPAETPVCLWQNGKGKCITTAESRGVDAGNGDGTLFECTRPSDCGAGFTCCTLSGPNLWDGTQCQANCATEAEVVCEKTSECPPAYLPGADSRLVATTCQKRSTPGVALPGWAGECR